jgi:uncharacterized protein YecE (DUF72 family)
MPETDPQRFAASSAEKDASDRSSSREDGRERGGDTNAGDDSGKLRGAGQDQATSEIRNHIRSKHRGAIYVGPAGWSYPDWSGYVYPTRRPKDFHEATYLARFFDTVEINTSFYAPMQPGHAHQWLERVAANPRFLFTAKLWQKFTHEPAPSGLSPVALAQTVAKDERAVRAGFDVLRNAGKLGAVLLQFPFSFHRTGETMVTLTTLLQRFADYPLAVELRHASWDEAEIFGLLREHHAAFCNIDQPVIGKSLTPRDAESFSLFRNPPTPVEYIRLHGRRYDTWFSDDPTVPSFERYNYLYSTDELTPWTERIEAAAGRAPRIFAVTNNHYLGKGVVNALQLISMLKGAKVNVPEPLREQYPQLEAIADTPPARPTLFPMSKERNG